MYFNTFMLPLVVNNTDLSSIAEEGGLARNEWWRRSRRLFVVICKLNS